MKIKYLGTAAAEGIPALFCSCNVCEKARIKGGKNIRTRSQALINDDLLIDFPADTYLHVLNYGLDLRDVKACLFTHSHDDHMYPYDLIYRMSPVYAHFPNDGKDKKPLDVYATARSGKNIKRRLWKENVEEKDANALCFHKIETLETYDVHGYSVTPLRARHDLKLDPVIYIISKDGKNLLYAHDTGYFADDTWAYIENSGIVFDFVSLDCTSAKNPQSRDYHMGLKTCNEVKQRLCKKNADTHTVFCLNHFSHNGGFVYDEIVAIAKGYGFIVSYDSMEVEF